MKQNGLTCENLCEDVLGFEISSLYNQSAKCPNKIRPNDQTENGQMTKRKSAK